MRLLICTQAVDSEDSNLGFFVRWIAEFAKHCERVEVICLREGKHELPTNVRVHGLGKSSSRQSAVGSKMRYALRFWKLLRELRGSYDAVFVHMNPEYLVLGGLLWRLSGKKVGLWYVHRAVNLRLRIATLFANVILTASPESFRLPTTKRVVIGHGIDTDLFARVARPTDDVLHILTLGRISGSKHLLEMLEICDELERRAVPFTFRSIGAPLTSADHEYAERLQQAIARRTYRARVELKGAIAYTDVPQAIGGASVFLNLSTTGSLDKAALEALAAGIPVVSTNEGLRSVLPPALRPEANPAAIADAVMAVRNMPQAALCALAQPYSLSALVPRILAELAKTA